MYCFIVSLCVSIFTWPYVIYFPTPLARYSLFVLKVPLNSKQTKDKDEYPLGEQVHGMWHFLPSVPWHCCLGDKKGIRPVKNWLLVCWWWWFDWSFARLTASVVITTSIIFSSNKIQNGDFLLLANRGKWSLNEHWCVWLCVWQSEWMFSVPRCWQAIDSIQRYCPQLHVRRGTFQQCQRHGYRFHTSTACQRSTVCPLLSICISLCVCLPHVGSGVVKIDALCFLAGYRTRRLNQAISVLCLSMFYCVVVY